jgi:hypothetical protein
MQYLSKHDFPEFGLAVKIYPDSDVSDPIKDYMEGIERWEVGHRGEYIAENRATTEDAFFLRLAQSIHGDFPAYLEGSEHAEKIAKKYYAISSNVCDGRGFVYLVGLKSKLVEIYGCPDTQELIEADANVYRSWANGDCVWFETLDANGNQIDSCGGFYSEADALEHAKENFPTRDAQYFFDVSENNLPSFVGA